MLSLTNPTWLFAIAALSIPVIIHLWNIRPGKTLKVGSIALMTLASRTSSRSFNLLDILLLILRCLFLILLAILLAGPLWIKPAKKDTVKGWILIPAREAHEVFRHFGPELKALLKQGYEPHWFSGKFEKIDTVALAAYSNLAVPSPRVYVQDNEVVKYWPLLKELNHKVPSSLPVYLFTSNGLAHFMGNRPDVSLNLHWQTYVPADSTSTWVQSAAFTPEAGKIRITQGNSGPAGTTFTSVAVAGTEQRNSPYSISFNKGQPEVGLKVDTNRIVVDTSAMRIAVYSDKNNSDARYLLAALQTVKQFTGRRIAIQAVESDTYLPTKADWLFWLSEKPVAHTTANARNLFVYQSGEVNNISYGMNIKELHKVALYKRVENTLSGAQNLWQDGFGDPVLSVEDKDHQHIYRFYSRFNPAWNDLVWSDQFPKVVLDLLTEPGQLPKYDNRILANEQIHPAVSSAGSNIVENNTNETDNLSKALWLLLVLVFIAERLLSHKTKTVENYG